MPARKGSIEGNFVTKTLNYVKPYIKPAVVITGLIILGYWEYESRKRRSNEN
jgi:hypothetical protein